MGANCGEFTRAVNTSALALDAPCGIGVLILGKVLARTVNDDRTPEEFAGAGALSRSVATDGLPPASNFGFTATGKGPVVAQTSLNLNPSTGGRLSQPSEHSCLNVQVPS